MASYKLNRSIVSTANRTGKLDLHGLSLDQVPTDLFTYPSLIESLTSIDLSGNHLKVLTPEISHFKRLRSLTLDGNLLTHLPIELTMIPALKTISLDGNPLPAEIMDAYQRSRMSGNAGREATSVLRKLVELEELSLREEEQSLYGAQSVQQTVNQIEVESGACTPRSMTDSLSDEIARVDSRFKQASLQSHVFDQAASDDAITPFGPSKKHSAMAHVPSKVFTAANDAMESHTSKRILAPKESAKSQNAPFGTDDQPVEEIKPRRLPPADANEKENDFGFLRGLGNNEQNRAAVTAGKRMMKTESRPSPFGVVEGKFETVSSSHHSQRTAVEARRAIDELSHDSHSTQLPAGRSDSRGSAMSDLLSQRTGSYSGSDTPSGLKMVKQTTSDIFHTSKPSSPVHARSSQPRSTAPWAIEGDNAQQPKTQSKYHQTSNVFNTTAEAIRTGRARIQPKQDNGIF